MTVTDETLGRAAMQYDDWQGTVAFDEQTGLDLRRIAVDALGAQADEYFLVGFDYDIFPASRADEPLDTDIKAFIVLNAFLRLYLVPKNGWETLEERIDDDGVLGVVAFDVENTPEVEEFLRTVSKRFRMRLIHRETINIPGFKDLRVIGDITELQDSDPEQIR